MTQLNDISDIGNICRVLVLPFNVTDISHHHIHDGVLYQAEKHEEGAGGHEHVDSLDVGDGRQRLLAVGVLGGEGQQGGHAQGHPGGDSLGLDPETDPGHHHDQAGGDVGVEHEVAQPPSELEDHHQAGEVTWSVGSLSGEYRNVREEQDYCYTICNNPSQSVGVTC